MIGPIPFEVPLKYAAGLADGSIVRFGTILKTAGTGQILAHVQEAGLAQYFLTDFAGSFFSPVTALGSLGSSIYSNIQLNHLKHLVQGLQTLQFATVGVALAGIGVSAIGFSLMNRKLNGIQQQVSTLLQEVIGGFQEMEARQLREHYSRMASYFEQADHAFLLRNPIREWRQIAGNLAEESMFFRNELTRILKKRVFNIDLFSHFVRSVSLCNAGRIECLMLSNELSASRGVAVNTAIQYNALFDSLRPDSLARRAMGDGQVIDRPSMLRFQRKYAEMKELIYGVREIQDAAASKPALLDTLIERQINGREFMEQLRDEKTQPIVLIPA